MKKYIFSFIGNFIFYVSFLILTFTFVPIIYSEINYKLGLSSIDDQLIEVQVVKEQAVQDSMNIEPLVPIEESFSVIIPKIDVNAPVVKNVTTVNQKEYMEALRNGVAHAKGTAIPGQDGNMFMFAHSSLNFWQLGQYATVFNLLHNLENGDTITIYYNGQPYIYTVFEKEIINGWNTEPYDEEYSEPVVTLVTCTPPGSTINRLVVKAKMVSGVSGS